MKQPGKLLKKIKSIRIKNTTYSSLILSAIIISGFVLRIYQLNWGAPFYFHPDERNLSGLLALPFFNNLEENFFNGTFSYGNLVLIYLGIIKEVFSHPLGFINNDHFIQATLLLRFNSVVFSTLLIFIGYLIGTYFSKKVGILTSLFIAFSPGLIQHAHFGTLDTFVTFWIFFSFYFLIYYYKNPQLRFFLMGIFCISIAASAKLNSLAFLLIPLVFFLISIIQDKKRWINKTFRVLLIYSIGLFSIWILSPYYLTSNFWGMFAYERQVVTGGIDVFYTNSFYDTTPIIFQFKNIYPFLLNPLITILFIVSFFGLWFIQIKRRDTLIIISLISFILLFFFQAFLFTKWSRYLIQTLPFMYLVTSIFLIQLKHGKNKYLLNLIYKVIISLIIFSSIFYAATYTIIAFHTSSPIEASLWAKENIPSNSAILAEHYDMGITAFNPTFKNISLFDFYSLDQDLKSIEELKSNISENNYIFLASQRVIKTRITHKDRYPMGYAFYSKLITDQNSFKKMYETPCNIFCKIIYLGDPIFNLEETTNIFERPTVMIFKKIEQ
jgi:hypothetical protein